MKKLFLALMVLIILTGCSDTEVKDKAFYVPSTELKVENVMGACHRFKFDDGLVCVHCSYNSASTVMDCEK